MINVNVINTKKKIDLNGHKIDAKKVRLEKSIPRGPDRFLHPGLSCSKLTTSLVNDSLKFQMAILQIQYTDMFC